MSDAKVFLVFGLPRSGTSLTARILHELGVFMGEGLTVGNQWNRDGYYECSEWNALCRRHEREGCRMHNGVIIPPDDDRPVVHEMRDLIAKRRQHERWGVKNLLIPYFLRSFRLWCKPHELSLVLCSRPFHAVINSFRRMKGLTEPPHDTAAGQAFGLYLFETLFDRHDGPRIRVEYEETVRDPSGAVGRLATFCGVPFKPELSAIVKRP